MVKVNVKANFIKIKTWESLINKGFPQKNDGTWPSSWGVVFCRHGKVIARQKSCKHRQLCAVAGRGKASKNIKFVSKSVPRIGYSFYLVFKFVPKILSLIFLIRFYNTLNKFLHSSGEEEQKKWLIHFL